MLAAGSFPFFHIFFPWSFAARSFLCHFYCSWHTQLHFSPLLGGLFLWLHPQSSSYFGVCVCVRWIHMLFADSHPFVHTEEKRADPKSRTLCKSLKRYKPEEPCRFDVFGV